MNELYWKIISKAKYSSVIFADFSSWGFSIHEIILFVVLKLIFEGGECVICLHDILELLSIWSLTLSWLGLLGIII